MKQLYILRHAKTNQISPTGRDFDRELLPKGMDQVQGLKHFFEENPLKNKTEVWVSSAKRTRQTFEGIKKALESFSTIVSVTFIEDLYLISDTDLLKKIWNLSSEYDLLIIGHNFGISELAAYFTENDIELRTGEFIQLSFNCDHWNETSKGLAGVSNRFRPLC